MSDHTRHFIPGPDGEPIAAPVGGCPECSALVASERIDPGAEQARRDDLARDVVRLWATRHDQPLTSMEPVGFGLAAALDRLAAAYGETP